MPACALKTLKSAICVLQISALNILKFVMLGLLVDLQPSSVCGEELTASKTLLPRLYSAIDWQVFGHVPSGTRMIQTFVLILGCVSMGRVCCHQACDVPQVSVWG